MWVRGKNAFGHLIGLIDHKLTNLMVSNFKFVCYSKEFIVLCASIHSDGPTKSEVFEFQTGKFLDLLIFKSKNCLGSGTQCFEARGLIFWKWGPPLGAVHTGRHHFFGGGWRFDDRWQVMGGALICLNPWQNPPERISIRKGCSVFI